MKSNGFKEVSRITLFLHHALQHSALELLKSIGIMSVWIEAARTARLHTKTTFLSLFGFSEPIEDSPTDVFRFNVHPDCAEKIMHCLINRLELRVPARGAVFCQNLLELSERELPDINLEKVNQGTVLHDLTLITGIQSKSASGESISKVALRLGAGVPTVSNAKGTGIRDRLGLLRITISPEKELTYLLVPSFDANGLQNLLIEKGKLNRPGGGFMYQTPIKFGLGDPLVRVGYQESAASLEQIVAAIDDLKKTTSWRKRVFSNSNGGRLPERTNYSHREICFICRLEHSDEYVQAAMDKGAAGATMTSMRRIDLTTDDSEEVCNYENAIMCVKKEDEDEVVEALIKLAEERGEEGWLIQKIPASSIYATYKKR